ncbi:hypothetical protein GCK72_006231 [Caenorhabditis remanei]|uniref:Uncharacterized protein n=1 Tax=Caenorhabditis remanei TaxID=31234 RepID=A0A6A5HFQ9_CAERE|nr:hypothetical protein GCK72_006231 [Caenorhabditis remanei]KAF1766275.1 hypothetical protein GCK72_006231 [Caenorhabditis remanei]
MGMAQKYFGKEEQYALRRIELALDLSSLPFGDGGLWALSVLNIVASILGDGGSILLDDDESWDSRNSVLG